MTKTTKAHLEEMKKISFPITIKVIGLVIKHVHTMRIPYPENFSGEFLKHLSNKQLRKYVQEAEKEGQFPKLF